MPLVAIVDGIRLMIFFKDHDPPHFHAISAEYRLKVEIDTLRIIQGGHADSAGTQGDSMGGKTTRKANGRVARVPTGRKPRANKLAPALRILSAEPVIHGVLKIVWTGGYAGIVDMRPIIAEGHIFSYLADPKHFDQVKIGYYGHSIEWTNEKSEQIDFGADTLRERAEKQAALLALAS
jgi:Domain of unknown function (DUF4160)/Protein of unknown function (DUF2442)